MRIQQVSQESGSFGATAKVANLANAKRAQMYAKRAAIVGATALGANSAYNFWTQKTWPGVPDWYVKEEYTGLKWFYQKFIVGQPTFRLVDPSSRVGLEKVETTGLERAWRWFIGKPTYKLQKPLETDIVNNVAEGTANVAAGNSITQVLETGADTAEGVALAGAEIINPLADISDNAYDADVISNIIDTVEKSGELYIPFGSNEATQFALFQKALMSNGLLDAELIPADSLVPSEILADLPDVTSEIIDHEQAADLLERFYELIGLADG